jgi:hypothetical protein
LSFKLQRDIEMRLIPIKMHDRVLAAHYGFTDVELDFIINYDIKDRMGRDAAEEEEE